MSIRSWWPFWRAETGCWKRASPRTPGCSGRSRYSHSNHSCKSSRRCCMVMARRESHLAVAQWKASELGRKQIREPLVAWPRRLYTQYTATIFITTIYIYIYMYIYIYPLYTHHIPSIYIYTHSTVYTHCKKKKTKSIPIEKLSIIYPLSVYIPTISTRFFAHEIPRSP